MASENKSQVNNILSTPSIIIATFISICYITFIFSSSKVELWKQDQQDVWSSVQKKYLPLEEAGLRPILS